MTYEQAGKATAKLIWADVENRDCALQLEEVRGLMDYIRYLGSIKEAVLLFRDDTENADENWDAVLKLLPQV